MKVAILGDTHIGVRGGAAAWHDMYERFYRDVFYPYLNQHNIKTVFQLGDLFDKKKSIDFYSYDRSIKYLFDPAKQAGIEIVCNVGNHDIAYKSTCELSAPDLLLRQYDNITIIDKPVEYNIADTKILILPWICKDNEDEVHCLIESTKAQICFGHLELSGFCMYKGIPSEHGMKADIFNKFDMVLTGHYHHKSSRDPIHYVGTPYELTWSDYDDPRGFHILDLETRELEFIKNPHCMFNKIIYDDNDKTFEEILDIDVSRYADSYVKVVAVNKTNLPAFEAFIKMIERAGTIDVKATENPVELILSADEDIDVADTLTLLVNTINDIETEVDRSKLQTLLVDVYNEATGLETT